MPGFHFFDRVEDGKPAGVTVSKNPELPEGDFKIDEYIWPKTNTSLWFVVDDDFSEDERQSAYSFFVSFESLTKQEDK